MENKHHPISNYRGERNRRITETLIQNCQLRFEQLLMKELNLQLIGAPLFLPKQSGLNDDLNGLEKAVSFMPGKGEEVELEVVHSLAKWKRNYLSDRGFRPKEGIITRMNAIRKDEELSPIHSYNVDQWDWEKVMNNEHRTVTYLKNTVLRIYRAMRTAQKEMHYSFDAKHPKLPEEIYFIHAEELKNQFPDKTGKEREYEIVRKHKAVFIIGIGGVLSDGKPHDLRAPDYDDWSTIENGFSGLNGDLLVWSHVLQAPLEISSMGIRVDATALLRQLKITGTTERSALPFHKRVLTGDIPMTIGGGIGRSRLTLFILEKAHIGEVQQSFWPPEIVNECRANEIILL